MSEPAKRFWWPWLWRELDKERSLRAVALMAL